MPEQLTCSTYSHRIWFGVPLEDIFPVGEIHPSLKELIFESYRIIVENQYSVEDVLSRFQGTLQERLRLKQRLCSCQEFAQLRMSPGAPIWVLRHFIGLLPIPLMPQYTDGQRFSWRDLSRECKDSIIDYVTRGRNNYALMEKLAKELLRLPSSSFLLLATLLNFLRMLAVLPKGEPKIKKNSVFALVKYFSSCLFLRPFRPGWITRVDKQYYPLSLYLILKWTEIRKFCIENGKYSFELPLEEIYPGYRKTSQPPEYPHYLSKRSKENTTQTVRPQEENETLIRIVPPSYHHFSHLTDKGCQTESFINNDKENISLSNRIQTKVIFLRKDCCCTYSSNYERNNPLMQVEQGSYKDIAQNMSSSKNSSPMPYGWALNETVDTESASPLYSSVSDIMNNTNYSYDDYSKFDLMCDNDESSSVYERIRLFDPIEKEEKKTHNEELKGRIAKMGWTYESSLKNKTSSKSSTEITPVKYPETKTDQYHLYYDVRKSLNEELKEKLNKMRIQEESDDEGSFYVGLRRSSSNLNLSEDKSGNVRNVRSVGKIKSKLEFLNVFNAKKVKTRKSMSCMQMSSNVKYEKMGSSL